MDRPRVAKTALDRVMQLVSVTVVLLVLASVLSNVRLFEQTTPRTSQTHVVRPTPTSATAAQASGGQPTASLARQGATSFITDTSLLGAVQVRPRAGQWPTWALASGGQVAVAAPPGAAETAAELALVRELVAQRDAETRAVIQFWDAGSPSYRWVTTALSLLQSGNPTLRNANQALAMLNVAVYDSTVSVWHAKYTYNRPRPAHLDPDLAAVAVPASPSYPDEHAAAAGAAATILAKLFPEHELDLADMAEQEAEARVQAGVAFPSDVKAGLALGREVAVRVLAYAGLDDASAAGTHIAFWWNAPPPTEPHSPDWRPWTLAYAGQFLPAAPAAESTEALRSALRGVSEVHAAASAEERARAAFWGSFAGSHAYWYEVAADTMARHHLDTDPPLAARIYALMSVAHDDASNACWDALSTYRVLRPTLGVAGETPLVAAPSLYSYPSLYACMAGAMSTIMAAVFPSDAQVLLATGHDAARAGLWADGTLPGDVKAGEELGRNVALHVLSHPLSWLSGQE